MSGEIQPGPNAAEVENWNAINGQTWARFQEQLDRLVEPLGREALRVLAPAPGERVMDVGCGCGQTTLDIAARVGVLGAVAGFDVSTPMLEIAHARIVLEGSARPEFRRVDVQTGDLGQGLFDAAYSRFGVMFFSDPVTAFVNLRKALKPAGRLAFVCWRAFADNPWMRVPLEAALPHLPPLAPMNHTLPGPFAFSDPQRVRRILGEAGFTDVHAESSDMSIGGSGLDATVDLSLRMGPLGKALRENPERLSMVAGPVRQAISAFEASGAVLMPAAVWIVEAKAG